MSSCLHVLDEALSETHREVRGLAESPTQGHASRPDQAPRFFSLLSPFTHQLSFLKSLHKIATLKSKEGKIGHTQMKWCFKNEFNVQRMTWVRIWGVDFHLIA